MDSVSGERSWTRARTWAELDRRLSRSLATAAPPLLFGLRMWASVCLALYLAFWLQLEAGALSPRLLADRSAKHLDGIVQVLGGLALLVNAPDRPHQRDRGFRLSVPRLPSGPHWRYPGFPRDSQRSSSYGS